MQRSKIILISLNGWSNISPDIGARVVAETFRRLYEKLNIYADADMVLSIMDEDEKENRRICYECEDENPNDEEMMFECEYEDSNDKEMMFGYGDEDSDDELI